MDIPYLSAYGNKNSPEYKEKVAELREALIAILKSKGIAGLRINDLTSGSVIVQLVLGLDSASVDATVITQAINDAIASGALDSINATGSITATGKLIY